jgi:hypothetical protein
MSDIVALRPTQAEVMTLDLGSVALDCFGRFSQVVEIFARGTCVRDGQPFVCFYTQFHEHSKISHSYKAGELVRTISLTAKLTSAECDDLETDMADKGEYLRFV